MDMGALFLSYTEQNGDGEFYTACTNLSPHLDHLFCVRAFVDSLKSDIIPGLESHIGYGKAKIAEFIKLVRAFAIYALGICVRANPSDPGQFGSYGGENFYQPFLRENQGVAVAEKKAALTAKISCCKFDIRHDGFVVFYGETTALIHTTK